jgi:DNA-binding SARP family transcriptional activator/Flp pilus assembly protein TadD
MSFSLKLFGGLVLTGEVGLLTGPAAQQHRLALLALLAMARPRAVSRDRLVAWLWPERDSQPGRRLLDQAVDSLRQTLGADAVVSAGDELQLDTRLVHCDVIAFERAIAGGELHRAIALYTGPFLDGFFLDDTPEFERWVNRERGRLAGTYAKVLEGLADAAEQKGESGEAVEWWKARASHDLYDSRVALRLTQALERAGNRAGALQHAMLFQQLLREELGIEAVPEIHALLGHLRREPVPAADRTDATNALVVRSPSALVRRVAAPHRPPDVNEAAPRRRRILRYAAAVVLMIGAIRGGMRLTNGGGGTNTVGSSNADEITRAVALEPHRRERGHTGIRLPQQRTQSTAYELNLRGEDPALIRSDSGARRGLEHLRRAIARDSTDAAAWVELARLTFTLSADGHPDSVAKSHAVAEAAVRKALALDDSLADAHALFGVMRAMAYDVAGAERHFRHAISLDPTRTRLREWFANFLLMAGRPVEALAEAERALAVDPLSPSATAEVARALLANYRCDEALARLATIAGLDPPLHRVAPIAARCYGRQGRWAEAIAVLHPQAELGDHLALALLGYMYGRAGMSGEAHAIHASLLDRHQRGAIGAYYLAFVPTALGDRDQAFTWLGRAYADGSLRFSPPLRVGFVGAPFDELRRDPRMRRLQARLGVQQQ